MVTDIDSNDPRVAFSSTFDLSNIGNYTFYIKATSEYQEFMFSSLFTVFVNADCSNDKFEILTSTPSVNSDLFTKKFKHQVLNLRFVIGKVKSFNFIIKDLITK